MRRFNRFIEDCVVLIDACKNLLGGYNYAPIPVPRCYKLIKLKNVQDGTAYVCIT